MPLQKEIRSLSSHSVHTTIGQASAWQSPHTPTDKLYKCTTSSSLGKRARYVRQSSNVDVTNNLHPFPRCPKPARKSGLPKLSYLCHCIFRRRRRRRPTTTHDKILLGNTDYTSAYQISRCLCVTFLQWAYLVCLSFSMIALRAFYPRASWCRGVYK